MPHKELTTVEKIELQLFAPEGANKIKLTESENLIKERYKAVFVHWCAHFEMKDSQIVSYIMDTFTISKTQAYRDLPNIKYLLGNVRNASKEWFRHMVVEMSKEAYQGAKVKKNWMAMIMAADKIGKYTKLDKDEAEKMPWNEIVPPDFEPSTDVRILSESLYNPNIEARRAKLRAKYSGDTIQEVDFTEVD